MANGRVTTRETGVMYRNVITASRCAPRGRRWTDRSHNNVIARNTQCTIYSNYGNVPVIRISQRSSFVSTDRANRLVGAVKSVGRFVNTTRVGNHCRNVENIGTCTVIGFITAFSLLDIVLNANEIRFVA